MFDYLNSPAFVETREGIRRFVAEELRPMEQELGLGSEDVWPRETLRRVWRRSAALGFYAACLPVATGRQGVSRFSSSARSRRTLPHPVPRSRRMCSAIWAVRRVSATCSSMRARISSHAISNR